MAMPDESGFVSVIRLTITVPDDNLRVIEALRPGYAEAAFIVVRARCSK